MSTEQVWMFGLARHLFGASDVRALGFLWVFIAGMTVLAVVARSWVLGLLALVICVPTLTWTVTRARSDREARALEESAELEDRLRRIWHE